MSRGILQYLGSQRRTDDYRNPAENHLITVGYNAALLAPISQSANCIADSFANAGMGFVTKSEKQVRLCCPPISTRALACSSAVARACRPLYPCTCTTSKRPSRTIACDIPLVRYRLFPRTAAIGNVD